MRTSQEGISLIKKFEGCRLESYLCSADVLTIGYGHTEGVYDGMKITQEMADEMLEKDLGVQFLKKTETTQNLYLKHLKDKE